MSIYKNNLLDTLEVTAKRIKKPVVVNNINDPRLKSYNDSLRIFNETPDKLSNVNLNNVDYKSKGFINQYYGKDKIKPIALTKSDGSPIYKKPVQQIVYQKPIQQTVQPVTQPTQTTNEVKENWVPTQNTIMYNMNGKTMYSTSDKINELFKTDIEEMTAAGVSPKTINTLLKQKYGIKDRGTTYTPDDATQKAITVRSTNLYK